MQTKLFRTKTFFSIFILITLIYIAFYTALPSQSKSTLKCNSIEECKKLFEESAKSFLGSSYSYGNTGKGGFDCSGLVLTMANKLINQVTLPRRSQDMYTMLTERVTLQKAKMGDLLFFNTGKGVSHVGLYWGKDNKNRNIMYHASSSRGVEMRVLDGNKYWMSRLVGIKRFAPLTNAISALDNEQNTNKQNQTKEKKKKSSGGKSNKKNKASKKILGILKSKMKINKAQDDKPQKEEKKISLTPTSGQLTKETQKIQTASTNINTSSGDADLRAPDEKPQGFYITADYKEELDLTSNNYQYPIPQDTYENDYEISYEYEVVYN